MALGFPAGCSQMHCALLYEGRFTAAGLQQFAAARLLRLPPLPPLSPRLLRPWLKAAAAVDRGGVALLVLLPEGQLHPAELLGAVARARSRGLAAAGVAPWRCVPCALMVHCRSPISQWSACTALALPLHYPCTAPALPLHCPCYPLARHACLSSRLSSWLWRWWVGMGEGNVGIGDQGASSRLPSSCLLLHVAAAAHRPPPWLCCRPADRAQWADLVGAASGPALIFWRGSAEQPAAVVQGSLLTNSIRWAAEVEQHTWQPLPQLHAASAAQQLPACQLGLLHAEGNASFEDISGPAWCMVLLGRGLPLAEGRAALEAALGQLASGGRGGGARSGRYAWGQRSPVLRRAAQLLADGRVQAAWADARQQRALCTHLLRWSGSSSSSSADTSCLCVPWWRRLPAAMLGQCRGQQTPQPKLVAYRQHRHGSRSSSVGSGRSLQQLSAYEGSLADVEQLAGWLAAVSGDTRQPHVLRLAPLFSNLLVEASPAVAATLAIQLLHLASWGELLWQRAARATSGALGGVNWHQVGMAVLLGAGLLSLKWVLDFLSGSEGEAWAPAGCTAWALGLGPGGWAE